MKICSVCEVSIGDRTPTGMCLVCGNRKRAADPAYEARRKAGLAAKWADPDYRAKMRAKGRAHALRMNNDPDVTGRRRIAARKVAREVLHRPDIREKTLQAVREKSGKTQSATRIAWCPEEHRPLYWYMRRTKRMTLAECKAAIANQIRADRARMSPFERQEADLRAKLERNDATPIASNDMFRRRAA